jgi:hypothetical protein
MSDRSSVPSIPLDYNRHRVVSPPSDPVPDSETPPAYNLGYLPTITLLAFFTDDLIHDMFFWLL